MYAKEVELPLQINTVFSEHNWRHFDAIANLVRELGVVFWEVFFLVPMGRGRELGQLTGAQFERMFAKLAAVAKGVDFIVKVTEAPHYRRYLMEQRASARRQAREAPHTSPGEKNLLPAHMRRDFGPGGSIGLAPKGINSGKGHLFVSYCGDICPSGFLPLACGNVRSDSIANVYRSHRVFCELRAPDLLEGKCGVCEFRHICGGSRARAYAMTGNYLAEEPFCAYQPSSASQWSLGLPHSAPAAYH